MNILSGKAAKFLRSESGATAVEYGLIMALMTIAMIGALSSTGSGVSEKWNDVSTEVGGAMTGAGS